MGAKKHVTSACLSCRRRKVKCDGASPCANCITSEATCEYNAQADLRKLSAKKVIANLEARLGQLEKTLRDHDIEQPPLTVTSEDEDHSSTQEPSTAKPLSQRSPKGPSTQSQAPVVAGQGGYVNANFSLGQTSDVADGSPSTDDQEPPDQANLSSFAPAIPDTLPPDAWNVGAVPTTTYQSHEGFAISAPSEASSGAMGLSPSNGRSQTAPGHLDSSEDNDDITDILAARMGSLRLAEDGQLRYYGSTSNLHINRNGSHSLSQATIRSVAFEGDTVLQKLGLDQPIPTSIETHLARLYFAWEDPAIHVIDEDIFFEEKRKWEVSGEVSPYYSETLNNSICAIGACLATHDDLELPENASEFFSERAKALLDIEMDSPTVATVQALVIMSASEAASTRDSRGWLYSGMAARLSTDLGLHLDVSKHQQAGTLTSRDLHIRQTAFWGVFIHENMWSSYVGRPGSMGVLNITVPRPSLYLDAMMPKTWNPFPATRVRNMGIDQRMDFPIHACTAANVTLAEFMRRINSNLYSGNRIASDTLFCFLGQTSKELESWLESLPECLQVDVTDQTKPYLPMVLQLHMQYCAVLLTLYRPYMSSAFQEEQATIANTDDRITLYEAGIRCVAAAHRATELLRCYKRLHSFKRTNVQIIHIIFTVALMLIHDVCTQVPSSSKHSLKELQLCCYAMSDIGRYYSSATRALETTIVVKGEWQKRAAAKKATSTGTKRNSMNMADSQSDFHLGGPGRTKRRQFSSVSEQGLFALPPDYSIPAVFTTQPPFNDPSGTWPSLHTLGLSQNPQDSFQGTDTHDFTLGDMGPSDWFEVPQPLSDNGSVLDPNSEVPSM